MTLEEKAEQLLGACTALIESVTAMVDLEVGKAPTATAASAGPGPTSKAPTKKELAELKKAAKAKAGKVLKELGKDKLGELLSRFGSAKFSGLLDEPDVYTDFVALADKMLDVPTGSEDDDLLGDGPTTPAKEYTAEDIRALLLKVNNAKGLGKDTTRQLLGDLGVARLPELKAEKFAEAAEMIEAALKEAGAL